jgi:hypothetical protein
MTEVLSTRALNRALLARQLLLERSTMPLADALEQVAGLQTQYAPSGYIGLWSRLEGFDRPDLTAALEERRAVQGTLMRVTIHIVSARDYPWFAEAVRASRREWWMRVQRPCPEAADMEALAGLVRKHLADGPRRQAELAEAIVAEGYPKPWWNGVGLWVDLVRVPPSGTWDRRRADLYGLAEDWLEPVAVGEAEAQEHLIRRYLAGFGPASVNDVASWAGMSITLVREILDRLPLRRFRDEQGGELVDVPDGLLPDPDTLAPVRFLGTWDANLLVHARRTQILPEAFRPLVFHVKMPQSVPTFLVDGQVAGKWRYEQGELRLEPFADLPAAARDELEDEARRLAAFHT